MEKFEFRKVRDFGEQVHDTFVFVKENWKPLLRAYATIGGIFIIAEIIVSTLYNLKMTSIVGNGMKGRAFTDPFQLYGPEYFLMLIVGILNMAIVGLIVYSFISLYVEKGNQAPTPEEVWGYVKFYFLRFVLSYIVLGLFLIVGFVFCLFPGIWLWPIVSIMMAIMVFENATLGYSFSYGFSLIKQNWWTTFGTLFIIFLVTYGITMVIIMPTSIISMGSVFLGTAKNISVPLIVLNSVLTGLCMVFLILPSVAVAISYFSLTETKEGSGLRSRIDMLGKAQPDANLPTEEY